MAQNLVMRQMDERQTEQEVSLMVWSPKMDILAAGMENGDFNLYRLQWHKVWTAAPPQEQDRCTAISWRPDGKLLATGYSSGTVSIRHIESSNVIHSEELDSEVTYLSWHQRPPDFISEDEELYSRLGDSEWAFLNRLPSLTKTYSYSEFIDNEESEDCRKLDDSSGVTVLIVGTRSGNIYVLVNGYLMCTKLCIADVLGYSAELGSVVLGSDLKTFSCVLKKEEVSRLVVIECPLLLTCQAELGILASKFSLIHGILQYTENTIKQVKEAWETILLEMDTKLAKYAESNPPGTVAADFLELLMFGTLGPQLESFLLTHLTDKGLKRLGQSIELSYSNIQRLVLRFLQPVCQSLAFNLGEMLGLARASHRFGVVGVTESVVQAAIHQSSRFWNKTVELQQAVDESMKNFKAFFRWLYIEILKKNGNEVPDDLKKVSQQDLTFIAEFLHRFQNNSPSSQATISHFYLEKVGQYLKDADLVQPPDNTNNPWVELLEEQPEISKAPFILPVNTKTSLVQEHNLMAEAVNKIFRGMNLDMTNECQVVVNLEMPLSSQEPPLHSTQLVSASSIQGIFSEDSSRLLYWEYRCGEETPLFATWLKADTDNIIVDSAFYTKDVMSILLDCPGQQTLVQFPLATLSCTLSPLHTAALLPSSAGLSETCVMEAGGKASCRELDNIRARQFAVSGPRKVSVFLFKNKKRLRTYEMEVEEEEDEEENFTSSGLSADNSSFVC